MADTKGKAKEAVGWLTADREVEAEGRAEQEAGGTPDDEQVDDATDAVRASYGETPDGADDPDRLR
jgi:uncharacterized protein YjbJ (UPF0337 family)